MASAKTCTDAQGYKDTRLVTGAVVTCLCCVLLGGCAVGGGGWQSRLATSVELFGHRNWILIADSAYPCQSRAGIETVATRAGQIEVAKAALKAVDEAKHVRAIVYVDAEQKYVKEEDAPGIDAYRKELKALFGDRPVEELPHEELIAKLDEAAKTFNVLILKTDMILPYTSVFLELDCGYWSGKAEQRLRATMQQGK